MSNVRQQGAYVPPPPPPPPPAASQQTAAPQARTGQPVIHSPPPAGAGSVVSSPPSSQVAHQGSVAPGVSAPHAQPKIHSFPQQQPSAPPAGGGGVPGYQPSGMLPGGVSGSSNPAASAPAPAAQNSPSKLQDIGTIIKGTTAVLNGANSAQKNFAAADASLQKNQYIDAMHSAYKGMDAVSSATQGALNVGATIANRAGYTELGKNMSDVSSRMGSLQGIANGFAQPLEAANNFLKTFNDPQASDTAKRTAASNFVNTTAASLGGTAAATTKLEQVDNTFMKKLQTTLSDYGSFGGSMAGLAQNGQDFRTAANKGDLNGMWKAGTSALQNGVVAGQTFASHVGGTLKEAGFMRAGTALENFGNQLGTLNTGLSAIVASNTLLPSDGTGS